MFKRLRRMKNNKLAWDDQDAIEIAAWIATYVLHAETAHQRALRSEMLGQVTAIDGGAAYWKNAASGLKWLLSMVRCPVHANDLYLSYLRISPQMQRSITEQSRRQLTIRFDDVSDNQKAIDSGSGEHNQETDSTKTKGSR